MGRPRRAPVVLLLALAPAACTSAPDPADGDSTRGTRTITAAYALEWRSYNNNTGEENNPGNQVVLNQVLRGFWFFDENGALTPDTEYGRFERTGEDPLTVRYTFADGARWSDGEPLDCDDYLLAWAANSGGFGGLFSTAGTTGYDRLAPPVCEDGDRSLEVTYTTPYADWSALFGPGTILPAHVVEERSGVPDLVAAITGDDRDALGEAAAFYNDDWVLPPDGGIDAALLPSAGPYRIEEWEPGVAVRLVENPEWWGRPPETPTIVVRFVADPEQPAALANGEVQVISPTSTVDSARRLRNEPGVEVQTGSLFAYDHLDVNFAGPLGDPDLREAFALCVPRRLIVDNLVRPVAPEVDVLDSRWYFPQSAAYQQVVEASYDGRYDTADVEQARAILEGEGASGTTLRIGYWTGLRRFVNTVDLIVDSCGAAGFDVQHAGARNFFEVGLADRNFDVALFAWISTPLVSSSASTFRSDGGNNVGGYANPEVDALVAQVEAAPEPEEQARIIARIERILWEDLPSIPLFAWPGLLAHSDFVEGPVLQPAQTGLTWNMHEWRLTD